MAKPQWRLRTATEFSLQFLSSKMFLIFMKMVADLRLYNSGSKLSSFYFFLYSFIQPQMVFGVFMPMSSSSLFCFFIRFFFWNVNNGLWVYRSVLPCNCFCINTVLSVIIPSFQTFTRIFCKFLWRPRSLSRSIPLHHVLVLFSLVFFRVPVIFLCCLF